MITNEQTQQLARQLGEAYKQGKTVQEVATELQQRFGLLPVKLVATALNPHQIADAAAEDDACHPLAKPAGRAWLAALKAAL